MKSNLTLQINSLEALERLIGNDNDTEIEIRNSVVQSFAKKHLKPLAEGVMHRVGDDIKRAVNEQVTEHIGTYKNSGWTNKLHLNDECKRLIQSEVESKVMSQISKAAYDALDKFTNDIGERIDKRVTRLCNKELEKLVNQRVSEKLEAIKSRIV